MACLEQQLLSDLRDRQGRLEQEFQQQPETYGAGLYLTPTRAEIQRRSAAPDRMGCPYV